MSRIVTKAPWLLALVPLWMIWRFGSPLPLFDDWDFLFYLHAYAARGELATILPAQMNESRPLFPRLVALPLDPLFHGDLRVRMILTWLLMCATAWPLWQLGRRLAPPRLQIPALLLANALLFAPVQFENWLWGNQVMFVAPLACLAWILLILCRPSQPTPVQIAVACVLATVATWSFANGVLCWIVLLVCVWLRRLGAPVKLAALGSFLGNAALYFPGLLIARKDPLYMARHPLDATRFVLSVLGSPLALGHDVLAPLIGLLLLVGLAVVAWRRRADPVARPFLILAAYSLVSVAIIASGRLELGLSQAFASRYTTVAILAYVALIWLATAATIPLPRWTTAVFIAVLALHATQSYFALRTAAVNRSTARFAHVCLSLPRPTEGDCGVYQTYPGGRLPLDVAPFLEKAGVLRRIPVAVPATPPPTPAAAALRDITLAPMPDHRWSVGGAIVTAVPPDAILFTSQGQVWAAAFPHPTDAPGVYRYSTTLPSAISHVSVYAWQDGDWTLAAEQLHRP